MFITRFIISNIALSFIILLVLIIRKLFDLKISVKTGYKLWLLPVLLMIIFLIPNISFDIFSKINNINAVNTISKSAENISYLYDKEFYISKQKNNISELLIIFYIIGFLYFFAIFIYGNIAAYKIIKKENLEYIKAQKAFNELKTKYKANCNLIISNNHQYPFSWGIIRPVIFIPLNCLYNLNEDELKFIISHEIIHIKHKDLIVNIIISVLKIIYWFNPFTHTAFKNIRLDMELCCDNEILNSINKEDINNYANTILKFIQIKKNNILPVNGIFGSKKEIFTRINKISQFNKNKINKPITFVITAIILIFSAFTFYMISNFSYEPANTYTKNIENKKEIDLSSYFKNYNGCFVLYNDFDNTYYIYNEKKAKKRFSPNSTYKILIALNALESNIISNKNSYISWDNTIYPFDEWNSDKTLNTAMKYSVNWYFQTLDKRLGRNRIKSFLNHTDYGNKAIALDLKEYWLGNSLKISPIEQVNFLKSIYNNELDYDEKNIKAVKNSLKLSDNLYGKTGTGNVDGKNVNGWFIGFKENNNNTYFFALYIESDENSDGLNAKIIADKILNESGYF